MYAIIRAGGSQQKVAPGDVIIVDKLSLEDGAEVSYDALMVAARMSASVRPLSRA